MRQKYDGSVIMLGRVIIFCVVMVIVLIAVLSCGKHPIQQDREDRKAMSSVEEL